MVDIVCEGGAVLVQLSRIEQLGALHRSLRIPVEHVTEVRVSSTPRRELRGWRAPGTGLPGVVLLGTWRARRTKDFAAVYPDRPAVVLDLHDERFDRVVVCVDDPDATAAAIAAHLRP